MDTLCLHHNNRTEYYEEIYEEIYKERDEERDEWTRKRGYGDAGESKRRKNKRKKQVQGLLRWGCVAAVAGRLRLTSYALERKS